MTPGLPSLWPSHLYGSRRWTRWRLRDSNHRYSTLIPTPASGTHASVLNSAPSLELRPYGPLCMKVVWVSFVWWHSTPWARRENDTFDRRYEEYVTSHHHLCRSQLRVAKLRPSPSTRTSHHSSEVSSVFLASNAILAEPRPVTCSKGKVSLPMLPPDAHPYAHFCGGVGWQLVPPAQLSHPCLLCRDLYRQLHWVTNDSTIRDAAESCHCLRRMGENVVRWVIMPSRSNVVVLNEEGWRFQWVIKTVPCMFTRSS